MTPCSEHALCPHEWFWALCFIASAMGGTIEQHVNVINIKFHIKLGKSATENLEMLCEVSEELF
jgi:hypothetical protein